MKPPTIRIRVAVAIDSGGEWNANGWGGRDQACDPHAMTLAKQSVGADAVEYWIEAEIPLPDATTAHDGSVIDADVVEPQA